jgi:hypothetical protein
MSRKSRKIYGEKDIMRKSLKNCEDSNKWGEIIFYKEDVKSAVEGFFDYLIE